MHTPCKHGGCPLGPLIPSPWLLPADVLFFFSNAWASEFITVLGGATASWCAHPVANVQFGGVSCSTRPLDLAHGENEIVRRRWDCKWTSNGPLQRLP